MNVNILNGGSIQLMVDPNILCSDLLEKVLVDQDIRDESTLGLAVKEGEPVSSNGNLLPVELPGIQQCSFLSECTHRWRDHIS